MWQNITDLDNAADDYEEYRRVVAEACAEDSDLKVGSVVKVEANDAKAA